MAHIVDRRNQYNDDVDHEPVMDTNTRLVSRNVYTITGLLSRMRPTESDTATRGLFEGREIPVE